MVHKNVVIQNVKNSILQKKEDEMYPAIRLAK